VNASVPLHPNTGAPLSDLLGDVVRARNAVGRVRRVQQTSRVDIGNARHDLVLALEAFTSCLEALGRPVPYALRDELRLQRRLDELS
jgi:hypothetical protein